MSRISWIPRRYVGHPFGVFVGQLEEQRVLVPEVVEDRAARQPDGLLEPAHGGLVVAVLGKARRGAVEDLAAPCRQMAVAHPGATVRPYSVRPAR
jgi:hypothetical protein